jgi:hypothetical protein
MSAAGIDEHESRLDLAEGESWFAARTHPRRETALISTCDSLAFAASCRNFGVRFGMPES